MVWTPSGNDPTSGIPYHHCLRPCVADHIGGLSRKVSPDRVYRKVTDKTCTLIRRLIHVIQAHASFTLVTDQFSGPSKAIDLVSVSMYL